jgi:hypothetical protein
MDFFTRVELAFIGALGEYASSHGRNTSPYAKGKAGIV